MMRGKIILSDGREVRVGDTVLIARMKGEAGYAGRSGRVTHIDDYGQIHGTWGGLALTEDDEFHVFHCDSIKDSAK